MCDIRFLMIVACPRDRGIMRLNIGPPSTRASVTIRWCRFVRPPVLGVGQGAL